MMYRACLQKRNVRIRLNIWRFIWRFTSKKNSEKSPQLKTSKPHFFPFNYNNPLSMIPYICIEKYALFFAFFGTSQYINKEKPVARCFGVLIVHHLVFLTFFLFRFLSISVSLLFFLLFFDRFVFNRMVQTRTDIR